MTQDLVLFLTLDNPFDVNPTSSYLGCFLHVGHRELLLPWPFPILSHTLDLKLLAHIHKIVTVIALLVNCQPHIIAPKAVKTSQEAQGREKEEENKEQSLPPDFWENLGVGEDPANLWDGADEAVELTDEERATIERLAKESFEVKEDEIKEGKRMREEEDGDENVKGERRRSKRLINKRMQQYFFIFFIARR